MYYLPYNKDLKEFSRYLRKNSTLGEVLLWNQLKNSKLKGYQFNRQKPLDNYIVDFYCKKLNLVIEVDGITHDFPDEIIKDERRQKILEALGLKFLRFREEEVRKNMPIVLKTILDFISEFEFNETAI